MPPCPHFDLKIVQRSKRQSAVAAAAYQSGERLFSEYDQKQKYYSHKSEIVHTEIMLPPHAPPEYADRNTLWNDAEAIEKQWNSQLARRLVLAIPRDIPPEQQADLILSLMELIVGGKDGLQPVERTVIDRCVRQMYREHLQNPETAEMPTLQTLYDLLCAQPEGEAVRLATSLEIYVSGSLNVFNHKTNVDLNRRLVCLDLKKLGAGLRTIAMLIMQDLVNSQVSLNFLRGIATWCYFDEFHVLLRDPLTASYCVSIWKMLRKKGCVPSALTQNVKDFLASPEIENIFENSDFLVLLSQAQGDRQILAKQLGISPHQLSYVTHTNSGEGLLFFGNTTIPFVDHFPQNTELYAIMTTRPEDKKREPEKGA